LVLLASWTKLKIHFTYSVLVVVFGPQGNLFGRGLLIKNASKTGEVIVPSGDELVIGQLFVLQQKTGKGN